MITLDEVEVIIADLPDVTEGVKYGKRMWFVGKQGFAWERPLSKADIKRLGDEPVPTGPILAIAVADLAEKEEVLAEGKRGIFTISHFDGYPAVLIQLDVVAKRTARELIVDAWTAQSQAGPKRSR
jgi:hypothetical protein